MDTKRTGILRLHPSGIQCYDGTAGMKKLMGHIPELFEEEEEAEFRRRRRYLRKQIVRKRPRRWLKGRAG